VSFSRHLNQRKDEMRLHGVTLTAKHSCIHAFAIALGVGLLATPTSAQAQAPDTVFVTVESSAQEASLSQLSSRFTWKVDPYRLSISQGATVEWIAIWEGCERDVHIVIIPKPPFRHTWPFRLPDPPEPGRFGSGPMRAAAQGHYEYGIILVCPGVGMVKIDPDMDVE
jgi:hypothetical protein